MGAQDDEELWSKRRDAARRLRDGVGGVIAAAERRDRGAHALALRELDALLLEERAPAVLGTDLLRRATLRTMTENVDAVTKTLEHAFNRKDGVSGLPTGFRELDVLTSGLQPGHLIFLAARPAMGKTALVSKIVCNTVIKEKKPVLYFSLDFSAEELTQRMISTEARLDISSLRRGYIQRHQWSALAMAAGNLSQAPLFIDERPLPSIEHIAARCREQSSETGLALVVVDHLQLISVPEGPRAPRIADVCLRLKALAQELKVPLVCLSQLGRGPECRADHRPMMWDLRDSGAVEPPADVVVFLYREEYYLKDETPEERRGLAELIVAKNRSGPVGTATLRFFSSQLRFEGCDPPDDEVQPFHVFEEAPDDQAETDAVWSPPPEPEER